MLEGFITCPYTQFCPTFWYRDTSSGFRPSFVPARKSEGIIAHRACANVCTNLRINMQDVPWNVCQISFSYLVVCLEWDILETHESKSQPKQRQKEIVLQKSKVGKNGKDLQYVRRWSSSDVREQLGRSLLYNSDTRLNGKQCHVSLASSSGRRVVKSQPGDRLFS
jgi:hypothetical protein